VSFGIDFGTSNCSVTQWIDGPEVMPLGSDRPLDWSFPGYEGVFPSVFTQMGDERFFGWGAKTFDGPSLQAVKRLLVGNEHMELGGRLFSCRHVAGLLFGALRARVEAAGTPLSRAVVTIPANSTGQARFRTRQAAKMAGIDVQALINEPTAAGMAYLADFPDVETLLVYDWGGGTIDATVLRVQNGIFEEMASSGIAGLGGLEVDKRLRELIYEGLPQAATYRGVDAVRFNLEVERAKILLSAMEPDDPDGVTFSTPDNRHSVTITRSKYEAAIGFLVESTMTPIEACLAQSGFEAVDIDAVLMVGGSSRIPLVRERLTRLLNPDAPEHAHPRLHPEEFAVTPVSAEVFDPISAVSRGAAVTAAAMDGKVDVVPSVINSHALGTRTDIDGTRKFSEVIPKGMPLPVRASKNYTPNKDFQRVLSIEVWEGDKDLPLDAAENVKLTDFKLVIPEPKPRSEQSFDLEYVYDVDGILHISVKDRSTGKVLVDDKQDFFDEIEDIEPEIADIEGTFEPTSVTVEPAAAAPRRPAPRPRMAQQRQVVVVDGSNLACHGLQVASRVDKPSYAQLRSALDDLTTSFKNARVLVVVDANFPHLVSASEKAEVQADIAAGRIILPPAGTNGAGDALVLAIADRDKALVVSNDSFQPFQDVYPWVREGRLIGATRAGEGWIFLPRTPPRPRTAAAPAPAAVVTPKVLALKPPSASLPVGWENSHWWSGE
jgi:molecular chaperone DnaK (HSP70)